MSLNPNGSRARKGITLLAQYGLIAKGFVYMIIGILAFMAAVEAAGQSSSDADKGGVLDFLNDSFAGKWLLPVLVVGLVCYAAWRFIESYRTGFGPGGNWKKALRYLVSGLVYLFFSFSAVKTILSRSARNDDSEQKLASNLLSQPFGQWLTGIAAIIIASIGVYQIYYALSEKYRKHVQKMNLGDKASAAMLSSGKTGYIARGAVWLIIAFLMLRAAFAESASRAGDTGKAFAYLESSPFGSYLLAALGLGLICYGAFNFVRARYDVFPN